MHVAIVNVIRECHNPLVLCRTRRRGSASWWTCLAPRRQLISGLLLKRTAPVACAPSRATESKFSGQAEVPFMRVAASMCAALQLHSAHAYAFGRTRGVGTRCKRLVMSLVLVGDGGCKPRRLVFFFFLFYNLLELGGTDCAYRTYRAFDCQQACLATYASVHLLLL